MLCKGITSVCLWYSSWTLYSYFGRQSHPFQHRKHLLMKQRLWQKWLSILSNQHASWLLWTQAKLHLWSRTMVSCQEHDAGVPLFNATNYIKTRYCHTEEEGTQLTIYKTKIPPQGKSAESGGRTQESQPGRDAVPSNYLWFFNCLALWFLSKELIIWHAIRKFKHDKHLIIMVHNTELPSFAQKVPSWEPWLSQCLSYI